MSNPYNHGLATGGTLVICFILGFGAAFLLGYYVGSNGYLLQSPINTHPTREQMRDRLYGVPPSPTVGKAPLR